MFKFSERVWVRDLAKQTEIMLSTRVKDIMAHLEGLRSLLTNIRGILSVGGKSKTGFLYDQAVNHNPLVVAVTETWLKPDMKDSELPNVKSQHVL